ncbi:oxidoreductase [Geomicrobium sp. JCM 19037]|uniref:SDR family oxidoreductase n=1 Tax=Geomicrobium sp. JCM 19037 TaxID=1460634 RepID=UPI00045F3D1D|nr:SDR family oxidoreductase [Geomicrobium sp. JCM 19037]GAK06192.1 oxidoreductase [Geomicrobium sp. JCM 19037]
MDNTYLITGYPGFIASRIVKEIIQTEHVDHLYLLVLPDMKERAKAAAESLLLFENQVTIVEGDITKRDFGWTRELSHNLKRSVTHVFHLAAIYDLAVKKKQAEAVNVDGTRNVNRWTEGVKQLKRYVYFSTAYVSGDRRGTILERELVRGQSFKNHYEKTKYDAEVLVEEVSKTTPTTIIRPGIVRGDSVTGETAKFDGVYFYLNILERFRQLRLPRVPLVASSEAKGNFVPVDYVVSAAVYLGHKDVGAGKTYHLTDPNPFSMREVFHMLSEAYLGKTPKAGIASKLAGNRLSKPLEKYFRVEKEALAYAAVDADYDTEQAERDLQGSGIVCTPFDETVGALVHYYYEHKNDKDKHIQR